MIQNPDIELIPYCIQYLKKERKTSLITFSLVLLLGLSLLFFFWKENAGLVIVGMFSSITGLKFLFDTLRSPKPEYHPLINVLSFHPEKIVWVYALRIDNMPFGIQLVSNGRLAVKLNDRIELSLSIPSKDISIVSSKLKLLLPHATFGFSAEKKQLYLIDPHLLLKDPRGNKA